jgi:hypothetical protein
MIGIGIQILIIIYYLISIIYKLLKINHKNKDNDYKPK